jgi:hypothetical protein
MAQPASGRQEKALRSPQESRRPMSAGRRARWRLERWRFQPHDQPCRCSSRSRRHQPLHRSRQVRAIKLDGECQHRCCCGRAGRAEGQDSSQNGAACLEQEQRCGAIAGHGERQAGAAAERSPAAAINKTDRPQEQRQRRCKNRNPRTRQRCQRGQTGRRAARRPGHAGISVALRANSVGAWPVRQKPRRDLSGCILMR